MDTAQKRQAVEESHAVGANVAEVAQRHGVRPALLSSWRRQVARMLREVLAAEKIRGELPDIPCDIRHSRSGPLLDALYRWFKETLTQVSAKSDLAVAIRYALSCWKALTRFTADGLIEIDNNSAERALRAVALGRNYYPWAPR